MELQPLNSGVILAWAAVYTRLFVTLVPWYLADSPLGVTAQNSAGPAPPLPHSTCMPKFNIHTQTQLSPFTTSTTPQLPLRR